MHPCCVDQFHLVYTMVSSPLTCFWITQYILKGPFTISISLDWSGVPLSEGRKDCLYGSRQGIAPEVADGHLSVSHPHPH